MTDPNKIVIVQAEIHHPVTGQVLHTAGCELPSALHDPEIDKTTEHTFERLAKDALQGCFVGVNERDFTAVDGVYRYIGDHPAATEPADDYHWCPTEKTEGAVF